MKKYLPFLKIEFANVIIYRGAVLVWMFSNLIGLTPDVKHFLNNQ